MLVSAYSTVRARVETSLSVSSRRVRGEVGGADPAFDDHLHALSAWVDSVSDATSPQHRLLISHLGDTRQLLQFELDPTADQLAELSRFAVASNAVLLIDGALLDPLGRPLLPGAHGAATGEVPLTPRARTRRDEVRSWLADNVRLDIPATVPVVRSADELELRSGIDVALGIISLVMASDYATAVIEGTRINQKAMESSFPRAFARLAGSHRRLLATDDIALAHDVAPVIEAAQELLWTVSRSMPGWPAAAAPVAEVMRLALAEGEQQGVDSARLRSADEILDEYQCIHDLALAQNPTLCDLAITRQRFIGLTWATHAHLDWDQASAAVDALIAANSR